MLRLTRFDVCYSKDDKTGFMPPKIKDVENNINRCYIFLKFCKVVMFMKVNFPCKRLIMIEVRQSKHMATFYIAVLISRETYTRLDIMNMLRRNK